MKKTVWSGLFGKEDSFAKGLYRYYLANDKLPLLIRDNDLSSSEEKTDLPVLPLSHYFVNLALQEYSEDASKKRLSPTIYQDIHVLFPPAIENNPKNTGWICITGAAGTGKTSFLQYTAYQWALSKGSLWNDRFRYMFRLPLNLLGTDAFKNNPSLSSLDDLVLLIHLSLNNSAEYSRAKIRSHLTASKEQLVLLLDGFDQIQPLYNSNSRVKALIDEAMKFPNGILSSRPKVLPEAWFRGSNARFVRHFENIGLTENNVKIYLRNYFGASETEKAETLFTAIALNTELMQLAKIPVNIAALCLTSNQIQQSEQTASITTLFDNVWLWLFRRYVKNYCCTQQELEAGFNPAVALPAEIFSRGQRELEILTTLSYEAFTQGEIQVLSSATLVKHLPQQILLDKISRSLGILRPCGPIVPGGYAPHEYVHSIYQEYLTALYMAKKLAEPKKEERSQELARRQSIQFLAKQIYDNRDNPIYEGVLKFLAGLVLMPDYSAGADYFLDAWLPNFSEPVECLAGMHPHMKWLEKNQAIFREAVFTYEAYQSFHSYILPHRWLILINAFRPLLQWLILQDSREFSPLWDDLSRKDQITLQTLESYQLKQRQYQQELIKFGLPLLDPLLIIRCMLLGQRVDFNAAYEQAKRLITGHALPHLPGIKILSKIDPYSERIIEQAHHTLQHPIMYSVDIILFSAEILLKQEFSKNIKDLYYRDLRTPSSIEAFSLQKQEKTKHGFFKTETTQLIELEAKNENYILGLIHLYFFISSGLEAIAIAKWLLKINPNNKEALDKLHAMANSNFFPDVLKAIETFYWLNIKDEKTEQYAQKYLKVQEVELRTFSAAILLNINSSNKAAIKALRQVLNDKNNPLLERLNAANILIKYNYQDSNVLQLIQSGLKAETADIRIEAASISLNMNVSDETAFHVLREGVKKNSEWTSPKALLILGQRGIHDEATYEVIKNALSSSKICIKEAAATVVKHIAPTLKEEQCEIILALFNFIDTYNYQDEKDNSLDGLNDAVLALLRIHPHVYEALPEFSINKRIQWSFVLSLWMHNGSMYYHSYNKKIVYEVMDKIYPFTHAEASEDTLTLWIKQLKNYQKGLSNYLAIWYKDLPSDVPIEIRRSTSSEFIEVLNNLQNTIPLLPVTSVLEPTFLQEDLPPEEVEEPRQLIIYADEVILGNKIGCVSYHYNRDHASNILKEPEVILKALEGEHILSTPRPLNINIINSEIKILHSGDQYYGQNTFLNSSSPRQRKLGSSLTSNVLSSEASIAIAVKAIKTLWQKIMTEEHSLESFNPQWTRPLQIKWIIRQSKALISAGEGSETSIHLNGLETQPSFDTAWKALSWLINRHLPANQKRPLEEHYPVTGPILETSHQNIFK